MTEQWLPSASDQEDMQGPTVDELLATIATLQATLAEREAEVNQLNNVMRQAGWGQGEIDSAAYTFEKMAEANRTLVKERDTARQDAARLRERLAKYDVVRFKPKREVGA